jgi:hypothetical protein
MRRFFALAHWGLSAGHAGASIETDWGGEARLVLAFKQSLR